MTTLSPTPAAGRGRGALRAAASLLAAALVLSAGAAAQAQAKLKAKPMPNFAKSYVKAKLGGGLAAPRYDRYHTNRLGKTSRTAPIQVTADFNGDGKTDWAGLVRTRSGVISLVAVYSTPHGYRHAVLQKDVGRAGRNLGVSVHLHKAGRVTETPAVDKPKSRVLRHPGIELIYFEQSSVVLYWNGKTFAELWTSD